MADIKSIVVTAEDIAANPILAELQAQPGDTISDTPAAAPVQKVGDVCVMPDGVTPGTLADDGTGTGNLICVANLPVAPAVGGVCPLPDGSEGAFADIGGGTLVCVPGGTIAVGEQATDANGGAGTIQFAFVPASVANTVAAGGTSAQVHSSSVEA